MTSSEGEPPASIEASRTNGQPPGWRVSSPVGCPRDRRDLLLPDLKRLRHTGRESRGRDPVEDGNQRHSDTWLEVTVRRPRRWADDLLQAGRGSLSRARRDHVAARVGRGLRRPDAQSSSSLPRPFPLPFSSPSSTSEQRSSQSRRSASICRRSPWTASERSSSGSTPSQLPMANRVNARL
jgi:hypothetical protein